MQRKKVKKEGASKKNSNKKWQWRLIIDQKMSWRLISNLLENLNVELERRTEKMSVDATANKIFKSFFGAPVFHCPF